MLTSAVCSLDVAPASSAKFAAAAQVGIATVNRFEAGAAVSIPTTLAAIERALEAAGVEFVITHLGKSHPFGLEPAVPVLRRPAPESP
jgi:hypothetical protein